MAVISVVVCVIVWYITRTHGKKERIDIVQNDLYGFVSGNDRNYKTATPQPYCNSYDVMEYLSLCLSLVSIATRIFQLNTYIVNTFL